MICMICSTEFIPKSHKPRCCSVECSDINKKAIKKEWYERNREKLIDQSRDYYQSNKKRIRVTSSDYRKMNNHQILEQKKNYRIKNRDKIKERSKRYAESSGHVIKNYNLKKDYNITLEQYEAMLEDQNGTCSICKNPERAVVKKTGRVKTLAVDHCHATGKVRGLLCWGCNISLGRMKDSVELLQNAIEYLKKHKE